MTNPKDQHLPKIGLALGSGGARGAAHTGVLKVLEAEGIPVSVVSGSSIGALVGAALAVGLPADEMEKEWLSIGTRRLLRSFLPSLHPAGFSSGNELKRILVELLGDCSIEQLQMPYGAMACDIDTGEAIRLQQGSLVDAVRASTAIPGVFHPMRHGSRLLVDGGLVDPVPIGFCRDLGAEFVIAVDITPRPVHTTPRGRNLWDRLGDSVKGGLAQSTAVPASLTEWLENVFRERPDEERPLPGLYSIMNQTVSILLQEVLRQKLILCPPDVLIKPQLDVSFMSYQRAEDGIEAGVMAAESAMPEIRACLSNASSSKETSGL